MFPVLRASPDAAPRTALLAILAVGVASEFVVGLVPLSSTPRRVDVDAIAAQAVAVDISSPYTPGACSFLKRSVREASIVQLGESIHVTAEFPRARLQLIRYLTRRWASTCWLWKGR